MGIICIQNTGENCCIKVKIRKNPKVSPHEKNYVWMYLRGWICCEISAAGLQNKIYMQKSAPIGTLCGKPGFNSCEHILRVNTTDFDMELHAYSMRKFRVKIWLHSASYSFEWEICSVVRMAARQKKEKCHVTSLTRISLIKMTYYINDIYIKKGNSKENCGKNLLKKSTFKASSSPQEAGNTFLSVSHIWVMQLSVTRSQNEGNSTLRWMQLFSSPLPADIYTAFGNVRQIANDLPRACEERAELLTWPLPHSQAKHKRPEQSAFYGTSHLKSHSSHSQWHGYRS